MWEVRPRNADLTRADFMVSRWQRLWLVERPNLPDTWTLRGPIGSLGGFEPGMGCILRRGAQQVTSGQVTSIHSWVKTVRGDGGAYLEQMSEVTFESDLGRLSVVVFPNPDKAPTTAPDTVGGSYDTRTGTVEDLILHYIEVNLGGLALVDREMAGLVLPASQGRGGTTTVSARFDNLGQLVASLAEAGNLRVTIDHDETLGIDSPRLALRITDMPDVSANVRFSHVGGIGFGRMTEFDLLVTRPKATRAISLGGGEDAARIWLQTKDTTAENLWGGPGSPYVREITVDQRQSDPLDDEARAQTAAAGINGLAGDLAWRVAADSTASASLTALRTFAFTSPPWDILADEARRIRDGYEFARQREDDIDISGRFNDLSREIEDTSTEQKAAEWDAIEAAWDAVRDGDTNRGNWLDDVVDESASTSRDFAVFITRIDAALAAVNLAITAGQAVVDDMTDFVTPYLDAAEVVFGMRVVEVTEELTRAGQEALADGAGAVNISAVVADGPAIRVREHYDVGYRVGVDLPGLPNALADNRVRELITTVERQAGQATEQVQIVVGTPGATATTTGTDQRAMRVLREVTRMGNRR